MPPDLMQELLQAADQYMLGSLKRLCEIAIADTLTVRSGHGSGSRPGGRPSTCTHVPAPCVMCFTPCRPNSVPAA